MLERRTWIFLGLIAAAHLGLALWFASFTPYRTAGRIGPTLASDIGAPDEIAHSAYVGEILAGRGAPSLDLARMKSDKEYRGLHYEDHQAPAFYFLDAGWAKVLGVGDVSDPSGGLRLRSLNALFGAGTVLAAFFAAYWGFKRLDLAFGAAGFVAFLPMNVALSGALSNDPMLFCELGWILALGARGLREGWRRFDFPLLGLLAGVAMLTKTTGLVSLPVLLALAVLPQPKRPDWGALGLAALACLVLAAPWFARNQKIYGDALGLRVFNEAFSDTAKKEDIEAVIASQGGSSLGWSYWGEWVGWTTARSFIGAFGYMDIWLNETGTARSGSGSPNALYRLSLALLSLLAVGWVLSLRSDWTKEGRSVTALNGIAILIVLALFWRFNSVYYQAQARYLFPALVPIAVGFAAGAVQFGDMLDARGDGKPRSTVRLLAIVLGFLLALTIYAGVRLPGEFEKRTGSTVGLRYGRTGRSVQV
jgi:4-amino-4-deoxy-L-arabinose transferase-like glycosyltransferase